MAQTESGNDTTTSTPIIGDGSLDSATESQLPLHIHALHQKEVGHHPEVNVEFFVVTVVSSHNIIIIPLIIRNWN